MATDLDGTAALTTGARPASRCRVNSGKQGWVPWGPKYHRTAENKAG